MFNGGHVTKGGADFVLLGILTSGWLGGTLDLRLYRVVHSLLTNLTLDGGGFPSLVEAGGCGVVTFVGAITLAGSAALGLVRALAVVAVRHTVSSSVRQWGT